MSRDDALGEAEAGANRTDGASDRADGTSSRTGGLRARVGRLFSPRVFLLALAVATVGLFVGGRVPFVGSLTRFVGLAVATFTLGVVVARRSYVEVALAAALASVCTVLLGLLTSAFLPITVDFLARSGAALALGVGVIGALVGTTGYYFGRDLRDGVTRSL